MTRKPRISPELLLKIKDAVNITDVVGEHVVLRKTGANHMGLCPFHQERSPSFSVNGSKGVYHCYGCKRGGDVVTFLTELHGISFVEAVEELSDRAGIALPQGWEGPDENPEATARRRAALDKTATATKLNRFVAAYYHQQLARNAGVTSYLNNRGVNAEQLRSFYVGHAPAGWEALASHLAAKQAPLPLAVELGLVRPSNKGSGHFDLFRNRAMFPIIDLRGKIVGFGGRTLPGGEGETSEAGVDKSTPKYLNSQESFLFHKSKVAFGMFQAQKHLREKRELILVEGYFDVIALHAAGFENVVATCGTSLTPDHLALFRRFADKIIILFDGDKAGISATERAMEIGLEHGLVLYGAAMPEGQDPDEVLFEQSSGMALTDGRERMAAILAASRPLLDARIEEEMTRAAQGPEARSQAVKQIGTWLTRFRDPVGQEVRVQDLMTRFQVTPSLLGLPPGAGGSVPPPRFGAKPGGGAPGYRPGPSAGRPAGNPIGPSPRPGPGPSDTPARGRPAPAKTIGGAEKVLLTVLARGGEMLQSFQSVRDRLPPGYDLGSIFEHPSVREYVEGRLQHSPHLASLTVSSSTALDDIPDPQVRSILTEAAMSDAATLPIVGGDDLKTLLEKRIAKVWARFSQQIKVAIADAEAKKDAGLELKLKQEYLDVQRKMKEFSSFYDEA